MVEDIWVKLDNCEYSSHFRLCVCAQLLSRVWLFVTPWTVACQASLSMGFSRQEYCSGFPFPSPLDLPDPGIKPESPVSPALAGWFFYHRATWEAIFFCLVKTYSLCKTFPICYLFGEIFLDFLFIREYLIYCQHPFNYELV